MAIKCGVPLLKLSKNAKPGKHKGDMAKVAKEALPERYSKDQDLDRSLSRLNEYTGIESGKKLAAYWEAEAAKQVDAMGRHLRSDAVLGYSCIVKPDMDSMQAYDTDYQLQFCRDARDVMTQLLQEHGLTVDATALHRDEIVPHVHILGHDPDFKAGKKIDLRLYSAFNREFPQRMRAMGYDVADMAVYDKDTVDSLPPEDAAAYKADCIERKRSRKAAGRSSRQYKADKTQERQQELAAKAAEMQEWERKLQLLVEQHTAQYNQNMQAVEEAEDDLREKAARLSKWQRELQARQKALEQQEDAYTAAMNDAHLAYISYNRSNTERIDNVVTAVVADTRDILHRHVRGDISALCDSIQQAADKRIADDRNPKAAAAAVHQAIAAHDRATRPQPAAAEDEEPVDTNSDRLGYDDIAVEAVDEAALDTLWNFGE